VQTTVSIDSRGIAGSGEIRKKSRLELVPSRDSPVLLVVTETGVDEDPPARRFGNERVNTHLEAPVLIGEIGPQPIDRQDRLRCRLGEDETAAARDFQFDDFGDGHLADPPFHHRIPPMRATPSRK
jgi:hypothetical protein